jgi:hypothetical protein
MRNRIDEAEHVWFIGYEHFGRVLFRIVHCIYCFKVSGQMFLMYELIKMYLILKSGDKGDPMTNEESN